MLQQTVPAIGSIVGNPLDSFEIFYNPVHISEVADIVSRDPSISMIVVDRLINRKAFHLPDLPDQLEETIERLISVNRMIPTIVTVDSGGGDLNLESKGIEMRRRFCNAGIPAYPSPARAIRALNHYYRYYFKLNQVLNNSHFGVQKS